MKYDLAVIGGGPAGMMAAGRAGELGARVILIEKNSRLGTKLLATGGGRCNLTNRAVNQKDFLNQFGVNGKFLFSALHQFSPEDTMTFFSERKVPLKVEENNRVFPKSDQAQDVLSALLEYLAEGKVKILTNATVTKIVKEKNKITKIILENGAEIYADKYLITTGGKSYPATGSSGDGYEWLKKLGHTIEQPRPALTPVIVRDKFITDLQGLSLSNVSISVYKNNKKMAGENGEIIFTHEGLSGPAIINISKNISRILPDKVSLKLDFFPEDSLENMDEKIQQIFYVAGNKMLKNSFDRLLPPRLANVIIKLAALDPGKQINSVTRAERKSLIKLLKEFALEIKDVAGFNQAMITAGGVVLSEIDPRTMKSKIIDNLYLAGEILDLDGPTGGFNLQVAWSTGYVAGSFDS